MRQIRIRRRMHVVQLAKRAAASRLTLVTRGNGEAQRAHPGVQKMAERRALDAGEQGLPSSGRRS
jgi:hypothetical protein